MVTSVNCLWNLLKATWHQLRANTRARTDEIVKPQTSNTPEQERIAALQQRADTAKQAVKAERQWQKVRRGQQQLTRARQTA